MPRFAGLLSLRASSAGTSRSLAAIQLAVIVALLGAFLSMMSVSDAMNGGPAAKAFLIGRMALLVLLCTWFLRQGGERWVDVGLRRPRRWWLVPLLAVGGFFVVLLVSSLLFSVVFPALGISPPRLKSAQKFDDFTEFLFFVTLAAWGSAAFGEEMLLRGFILDRIAKILGSSETRAVVAAVLLQGTLFGLFHFYQGLGGILVTGTLGILFGLMWLLGGRNLWACIILHGLINTISDLEAYGAQRLSAPVSQQQQHGSDR